MVNLFPNSVIHLKDWPCKGIYGYILTKMDHLIHLIGIEMLDQQIDEYLNSFLIFDHVITKIPLTHAW